MNYRRLGKTEKGLSNLGKDYKAQEQRAIDNMAKFRAERDERRKAVDKRLGKTETGLSNLGKDYKAQEQRAIDRMTQFRAERDERRKAVDKRIGGVEKEQTTTSKRVAGLASDYKASEARAFAQAKAFQEAKKIAQRNPNVSVGVDSKGKPTATANQKTRSEAGAKTAQANKARV